jgi:hypothetical protein
VRFVFGAVSQERLPADLAAPDVARLVGGVEGFAARHGAPFWAAVDEAPGISRNQV